MATIRARKTTIVPADTEEPDIDQSLMDQYLAQQGGEGAPPEGMAEQEGGQEAAAAEQQEQASGAEALELSSDQVNQMRQMKQAGDYEGLGKYVADLIP